jgi:cytochrome c biogenesis protein CcdA
MSEIWSFLAPILVADLLNPVLFAFLIFAAGTSKPVMNSTAILLGHTVAYFTAGIGLALGIEKISHRLANPHDFDYVIGLILGCLLLWIAFKGKKKKENKKPQNNADLTPFKSFGLGAIVNFIGIPFALPYFAAIDHILKADINPMQAIWVLVGYNLIYAIPFAVVPILIATNGERSKLVLQRINDTLMKGSDFLMPILLGLIGIGLVVDSIVFFVIGKGLL